MTANGAVVETPRRRALTAENLVVEFPVGGGQKVHAVSGVSLELAAGRRSGSSASPAAANPPSAAP